MEEVEKLVRSVETDGLVWGAGVFLLELDPSQHVCHTEGVEGF